MSFNIQETKFQITITKLKERKTYRAWREGFLRYLKSLSLDKYINYEFAGTYQFLNEKEAESKPTEMEKLDSLGNLEALPSNLLMDLDVTKRYTRLTKSNAQNCPVELLKLLGSSELILNGNLLYIVTTCKKYIDVVINQR